MAFFRTRFMAAVIAGLAVWPAQAIEYVLLDLGVLPGNDDYLSMHATGINASGQVIGYGYKAGTFGQSSTNEYQAFVTGANGAGMTRLGTLGGSWSQALGINDAGQVVGVSGTAEGASRAFLGSSAGGPLSNLGALGGTSSTAAAINSRGQVAGTITNAAGQLRAFVSDPGATNLRELGTLGGSHSTATGINERGQVVGGSDTVPGWPTVFSVPFRPFISGPDGGALREVPITGVDPSSLQRQANAVNDRGDMVGTAEGYLDYESRRPFYAASGEAGRLLDISPFRRFDDPEVNWGVAAEALAINSSGQVGGAFEFGLEIGAFISGPDGMGLIDLLHLDIVNAGDSPGGFYSVTGINDAGQFVANSFATNRAYLLTPIPEPASAAMLLAGAGLIAAVARRRQRGRSPAAAGEP